MTTLYDLPPSANGGHVMRRRRQEILDRAGICPHVVAAELGLDVRTVRWLQLKLGVRKFRSNGQERD